MFDMESRPTIVKSVVELADPGIESADSTAVSAIIPLKIGLWVWALKVSSGTQESYTLRSLRDQRFLLCRFEGTM